MSFRTAKSRLKIDKVGGLGRPRGECAQGSAGRAVATGGFWSLTRTGKSLTMHPERPAPRRGAADPSAQAQREHIRKVEGVDLVSSALDW